MSRLHTVVTSTAEVAAHFNAEDRSERPTLAETVEGTAGLVVFESKGRRILKSMHWGFPRITREMHDQSERPIRLGLVADLTNGMWEKLVVDPRYRCLIVLTHFANPEGERGEKTRTWFSANKQPIVAWAGFCRNLPDYGPVYAGMTMTANDAIMPTNDRMPVLLDPHEYDGWLHGSIQDVIGFQFRAPFPSSRMDKRQTEDRWRSGKLPNGFDTQMAMF